MRETYQAEQQKTKDDTSFISAHQTQTIIITFKFLLTGWIYLLENILILLSGFCEMSKE